MIVSFERVSFSDETELEGSSVFLVAMPAPPPPSCTFEPLIKLLVELVLVEDPLGGLLFIVAQLPPLLLLLPFPPPPFPLRIAFRLALVGVSALKPFPIRIKTSNPFICIPVLEIN